MRDEQFRSRPASQHPPPGPPRWFTGFCTSALLLILLTHTTPRSSADAPPALQESAITPADRNHWSFRVPVRPTIPAVKNTAWPANPIDAFILAQLEAQGLEPAPPADPITLLRRLSFDLTGLPPTPAEIDALLEDDSTTTYERTVDPLLASPAYGERWAQHWLDLARFAETDGFEHDFVRPNAWRYRDWVIAALNRDLPFDEFTRLQIAGDEIHPGDPAAAIATGFLLCGPDMPDINSQDERRHTVLNELTGATGSVFLALQLGCAQCHDHKYDPISQADFYRMRAFFDSTDCLKEHPIPSAGELAEFEKAKASTGAVAIRIESQIKELRETARKKLREQNPDIQPNDAELLAALTVEQRREHNNLTAEAGKLKKLPPLPSGRVMRNSAARSSFVMLRGDHNRPGAEVTPAALRVVQSGSGDQAGTNRSALAEWLTEPNHPLTARVIVNRVWQFHFGEGLVRSASDFGKMGDEPTHPALLDWLATELPRQGWSLKWLHRLIVTSATYRQSSRIGESSSPDDARRIERQRQARTTDPENRQLARMSRRRLDGEEIRDAMLRTCGRLSDLRGGPGVRPPLPRELVGTLLKNQWEVSPDPEDHVRRSVYLFVRRNLRYPLFEAFDRPDANASCARRNRSTIAPQALFLLNADLALQCARDLAGILIADSPEDQDKQIRHAYLRALSRHPTDQELSLAQEFLTAQAMRLQTAKLESNALALPTGLPAGADPYRAAALTDFCLALFNLNEFVYVD